MQRDVQTKVRRRRIKRGRIRPVSTAVGSVTDDAVLLKERATFRDRSFRGFHWVVLRQTACTTAAVDCVGKCPATDDQRGPGCSDPAFIPAE